MTDYKQRIKAAVKEVDALIVKHGLAPVAAVVNKRKKEKAIEKQLAASKRELEAELEKIKNQLAKI